MWINVYRVNYVCKQLHIKKFQKILNSFFLNIFSDKLQSLQKVSLARHDTYITDTHLHDCGHQNPSSRYFSGSSNLKWFRSLRSSTSTSVVGNIKVVSTSRWISASTPKLLRIQILVWWNKERGDSEIKQQHDYKVSMIIMTRYHSSNKYLVCRFMGNVDFIKTNIYGFVSNYHNFILMIIQKSQKNDLNISHFNVFDVDNLHFKVIKKCTNFYFGTEKLLPKF